MIISRTPYRISFFGGGTDFPAWFRKHGGAEVHPDGDLPARSGMGTSSSFTVGLLHALYALKGFMPSATDRAATKDFSKNRRNLFFWSKSSEIEYISDRRSSSVAPGMYLKKGILGFVRKIRGSAHGRSK